MESQRTLAALDASVYDICFSPDGKHLVSAGRDGRVALWSLDGRLERSWTFPERVTSAAFSPAGDRIAVGSPSGELRLLRPSRDELDCIPVPGGGVESLAFTSDGRNVLIGAAHGEAVVVDVPKHRVARTAHVASQRITSVSFAPAGDLAVLAAAADGILFLEYPSLEIVTELTVKPLDGILAYRAVFARDASCAAAVTFPRGGPIGNDSPDLQEILLWCPREEAPRPDRTLLGHLGWTGALTFSRSGRLLASGGFEGALHLWHAELHLLLGYALEHDGNIHAVACSPDDTLLATASADGTIRLWDLTTWSCSSRPSDEREPRGRTRGWQQHVMSIMSGPGHAPFLTACARIADALLAIDAPDELRAELDAFVSLVVRADAVPVVVGVSQTLERWSEQAKRESDARGDLTAFRCERVLSSLNWAGKIHRERLARDLLRSVDDDRAMAPAAPSAPTQPDRPSTPPSTSPPAACGSERREVSHRLEPVILGVAAGTLGADSARTMLASARIEEGEMSRIALELGVRWFSRVLEGSVSAAPVIAAAELALDLAVRSGSARGQVGLEQALGRVHAVVGHHAAALHWIRRALEDLDRVATTPAGLDTPPAVLARLQAQLHDDLGNVLRNAGHLRAARQAYARALEIAREKQFELGCISALLNLSIVEADLGNTAAETRSLVEARARAMALLDDPAPRSTLASAASAPSHVVPAGPTETEEARRFLAAIENGLGGVYRETGEYEAALRTYRAVLRYARHTGDARLRAKALGNVGLAYHDLGRLRLADRAHRASLTLANRLGDESSIITALLGLAGVAAARGDQATEERYAREALTAAERAGSPEPLLEVQRRLARAVEKRAPAEVRPIAERAVAAGELLRGQVSRPQEAARIQTLLGELHAMMARIEARAGRSDEAFDAAERARAALLLRRLRRQDAAAGQPIRTAEALALLERLGPRSVLASYFSAENEVLLFTLRPGEGPRLHRPSVSVAALNEARNAFRREVTESGGVPMGETWMEAYGPLIAPLAPLLHDQDLLLIAPHGPLHGIPLHAVSMDGERLLSRCSVAYLPSVSALPALLATAPGPPRTARVVGQHFEREAREVAALLGVPVEPPGELDRERFLQVLRVADAVHVSAYGFFSELDPRASGVIVQPSDAVSAYLRLSRQPAWKLAPRHREVLGELTRSTRSSIVSVADLEESRLGARFVTLSACESGVVAVDRADDPTGLVPALMAGGTTTVVATLWLVDADATREFMARLYRELLQGGWRNGPQALRAASLDLMRRHPHPYHWAPFVMFGGLHPGVAA